MDVESLSPPLQRACKALPERLQHQTVLSLLQLSVAEDVDSEGTWRPGTFSPTRNDVTSVATIPPNTPLTGTLVAKEAGVLAGIPLARAVCFLVDERLRMDVLVEDGEPIEPGQPLARVSGPGRALLTAERAAVNFVGRLSGIATLTQRYVEAVAHTDANIFDTRKTLPGSRRPNKYAVRQGGGKNHRFGLFDMVLVKDNHIDGAGGITDALRRVREQHGDQYSIEIEVKTLDELKEALDGSPDIILLDNMDVVTLRRAVDEVDGEVALEASGNVTLDTVATVAETGVDRISVGALTHSAPTLDVSLRTG